VGVVAEAVGVTGVGAPLLVSLVGAEVGNHDGNGRILNGAVTSVRAIPGRSNLEARATA